MDGPQFAKHLGTWISPAILAAAAGELRDHPARSAETEKVYVSSRTLETAAEAGYADLIQFYLDHFFVPEAVLSVARAFWGGYFSDPRIAQTIRTTRFSGKLYRDVEKPPVGFSGGALMVIETSCLEWRLLERPVTMLSELVSTLADPLKRARQAVRHTEEVHQENSHDGPLAAFVEAVVGQAYGLSLFGKAAIRSQIYATVWTPRLRWYHGPAPIESDILLSTSRLVAEQNKLDLPPMHPAWSNES